MHRLRERNKKQQQQLADDSHSQNLPTVSFEEHEPLPPTLPTQHHHISIDTRQKVQLSQWLYKNRDDPALLVSIIYSLAARVVKI